MAVAMDAGGLEERSIRLSVAANVSEHQKMVPEVLNFNKKRAPIREDVGPVFIVLLIAPRAIP
jgi:hypothetical protein